MLQVRLQHPGNKGSKGPSLEVGPEWTMVTNAKEFRVRSPTTGRTIFSTEYQGFQLPKGIPNLNVKEAHVSRVTISVFVIALSLSTGVFQCEVKSIHSFRNIAQRNGTQRHACEAYDYWLTTGSLKRQQCENKSSRKYDTARDSCWLAKKAHWHLGTVETLSSKRR